MKYLVLVKNKNESWFDSFLSDQNKNESWFGWPLVNSLTPTQLPLENDDNLLFHRRDTKMTVSSGEGTETEEVKNDRGSSRSVIGR